MEYNSVRRGFFIRLEFTHEMVNTQNLISRPWPQSEESIVLVAEIMETLGIEKEWILGFSEGANSGEYNLTWKMESHVLRAEKEVTFCSLDLSEKKLII